MAAFALLATLAATFAPGALRAQPPSDTATLDDLQRQLQQKKAAQAAERAAEEQKRKTQEAEEERKAQKLRQAREAAEAQETAARAKAARDAAEAQRKADELARQQKAVDDAAKRAAEEATRRQKQAARAAAIAQAPTLVSAIDKDMRIIPAGEVDIVGFLPKHPKHADVKAFRLGAFEVTFDQYDLFATATDRALPEDEGWGRGNRPVINVTKSDAEAFVYWLNQRSGKRYRLPTQAEWQHAAQAGSRTRYPWGSVFDPNLANAKGTQGHDVWEHTAPVGSFPPNKWGLYDMIGNVSEFTADNWTYDSHYSASADLIGSLPLVYMNKYPFSWQQEYKGVHASGSSWDDDGSASDASRREDLSLDSVPARSDLGFRLAQDP
jgi:formylglycine-generating enzyme required for sulfatase activity